MTTCPSTHAPLHALTVAPALARAASLRADVLYLHRAPPELVPGAYVAVCGGEGRDEELVSWFASSDGPGQGVPDLELLPQRHVTVVARVVAVTRFPEAPRHPRLQHFATSPWYRGPYGLWLEHQVALPEWVPCELRAEGEVWAFPEDVLTAVRAGYEQAQRTAKERREAEAALAARCSEPIHRPGLRERVLAKCPACRKAMAPCRPCQGWRCNCSPHVCPAEARP